MDTKANNRSWQAIYNFGIYHRLDLSQTYLYPSERLWYGENPQTDVFIENIFSPYLDDFDAGRRYDEWKQSPQGFVAYIILLDFFPRYLFLQNPRKHTYEQHALNLTLEGIRLGIDKDFIRVEKHIFNYPLRLAQDKYYCYRFLGR